MRRETITLMLNGLADEYISEAAAFCPASIQESPERIVPMNKKRIITFALAAALILALGATAYAFFGFRSVGTHEMPETGVYTSLAELKQVEKTVGYAVTAPESFSNGYSFSLLTVRGEAVYDESNEVEKEFYGVHVDYTKAGSPNRYLDLSPIPGTDQPEPTELRFINGVSVRLNLDHYKIVPEDYQETDEDRAREAGGHYYLSYGSEDIMEFDMASACFEINGVEYILSDMAATEGTLNELAQMTAELIAAAR